MDFKENISVERYNELCKLIATQKTKVNFKDFTKPEVIFIIDNTILKPIDIEIAKMRYVYYLDIKTICARLGIDKANFDYHRRYISKSLKITCTRIFKN